MTSRPRYRYNVPLFSPEEVVVIRKMLRVRGARIDLLAEMLGISTDTLARIKNRRAPYDK